MKTKENGVTLLALVITIILILILASIGVTVGTSTLDTAAFAQFKSELEVMQDKVNGLNQENKTDIGKELTDEQKDILNNITVISDIIFNGKNKEEKIKIQNGFKYLSKEDISNELNLDSVKRNYLINVEYRYVIFPDGYEYDGTKYYMIDQIEGEIYNVRYNDKNEKTGNYDVNITRENDKCKVEITNISYSGYVDKWQVKYQLEGNPYWGTSDDLTFYIKKEGTYTINVVHGDEIDLGEKKVRILYDGLISNKVKNGVVKIGDYVQYTPDEVNTTDEAYINLISDLGTYSGSDENTTLTQENLNWRVLDIVNGKVRLISELPTTSTVTLQGYNGYNNGVYLLDKTCSTLYNNLTYAEKVQSLKIEDIQRYINETDYSKLYPNYGSIFSPPNKWYPSILTQEEGQKVDGTTGTLGLSKQTTPISQTESQQVTSWEVKTTYWYKTMVETDFVDSIYYNLFINNGSNYSTYWMSSRCISAYSDYADFCVCNVYYDYVRADCLYNSYNNPLNIACTIRPVITLKSDVQIDATDIERDGTTATKAYVIK